MESLVKAGEGPLSWPPVAALHPDRHFDTIACSDGDFCTVLARLAGGVRSIVAAPAWGERLRAKEMADRCVCYETLGVDRGSAVRVERIRPLLGSPVQPGLLRVVFNGWAGPYLCRPLAMGADAVAEDLRQWVPPGSLPDPWRHDPGLPCWALVVRSPAVAQRLEVEEAPGPTDPSSLRTLSSVSQRRSDTALAVAHFLAAHPQVAWVSYPGLATDEAHEAARSTLEHGFGPLVAFGCLDGRRAGTPLTSGWEHSCLGDGPGEGALVWRAGLESPLDCVDALERWLAGD